MKAATWEEVDEKSFSRYLVEAETLIIEEEFNINQMIDWNDEEESIIQEEIDEILNKF